MKKILILFLIFCLFSSREKAYKKKYDFKKSLIGDEKKIWSLWAIEKNKYIFLEQHNIFNKNNIYAYYQADNDKELGSVYSMNTVNGKDLRGWDFSLQDSILALNDNDPNFTYKIVRYTKDTIWMEGYGYKGKFALIRINVQIPKEED